MPYELREENGQYCVYKKTGEKKKCYKDKAKATAYLRALYANVQESIVFEQVNGSVHFDVVAQAEGDLLIFRNAILARAEVNRNRDEFDEKGMQELANTVAGRAIDFEHDPRINVGYYTAGRSTPDGKALSVDGVIWADRYPAVAEDVQSGKLRQSIEANAQNAICSQCGGVFASKEDYCEHLQGRKGTDVVRKLSGLKAKGGGVTYMPAGSDTSFSNEIYVVASHQEETMKDVDMAKIDVLAAALDICANDLLDYLIDVEGKMLSYQERKNLDKSDFALPENRRFPIHDCAHARNALSRLPQAKGLSDEEKATVKRKAESKLRECNKSEASMDKEEKKEEVEEKRVMTPEEAKAEDEKEKKDAKDTDEKKDNQGIKAYEETIANLNKALEAKTAELTVKATELDAANKRASELESRLKNKVLAGSFSEDEIRALKVSDWSLDQIEVLASTRGTGAKKGGGPVGIEVKGGREPLTLTLKGAK